ncbi:MAG: hypothetical protein OXU27_14980 [Candidatus Poribacteria bacterium]|nr:hypothetical protein [Candidatus Poribacteria bacterium]MDD9975315.1 hypothetical protein [Candidatus Poribacteria bacterium]MDE0326849.1 hypothetical protein [Candidatus Poribacteria bacterium]
MKVYLHLTIATVQRPMDMRNGESSHLFDMLNEVLLVDSLTPFYG